MGEFVNLLRICPCQTGSDLLQSQARLLRLLHGGRGREAQGQDGEETQRHNQYHRQKGLHQELQVHHTLNLFVHLLVHTKEIMEEASVDQGTLLKKISPSHPQLHPKATTQQPTRTPTSSHTKDGGHKKS